MDLDLKGSDWVWMSRAATMSWVADCLVMETIQDKPTMIFTTMEGQDKGEFTIFRSNNTLFTYYPDSKKRLGMENRIGEMILEESRTGGTWRRSVASEFIFSETAR